MHAAHFAALFAALFAAHHVADHWIQTDTQAANKSAPGRPGRLACTWHVATYTLTAVLFAAPVVLLLGVPVHAGQAAAALALSAVSHWLIDRRWLLLWVADRTGSARFVRLGAPRPGHNDNPSLGTGAYALDQSAHIAFLFAATLIAAL